jgi:hypothetical protein
MTPRLWRSGGPAVRSIIHCTCLDRTKENLVSTDNGIIMAPSPAAGRQGVGE